MKHARILVMALLGFVPSAQTLEMTAGGRNAQANAGFEMRLTATTSMLQAAIEQLTRCNANGKFYQPSTPGADADGCVEPIISTPPPPTSAGVRLSAIAYHTITSSAGSSTSTTYTPWVAADICVLARVAPGTTEDNHSHGCVVEQSGNNYRTASTSHKGSTRCDMRCYNLVPE